MADPLSITASIAGLLSLVISVTDTTFQYVTSARNASSTISALFQELQSLKAVLVKLDEVSHTGEAIDNLQASKDGEVVISMLDIETCSANLTKIQGKLKARMDESGSSKKLQRFIWPFLEDSTVQMVKQLHRYVDIFHVALSADALYVRQPVNNSS
jgi:uncharacterized protein (DUF2147 family)